jgi:hypothetical protein
MLPSRYSISSLLTTLKWHCFCFSCNILAISWSNHRVIHDFFLPVSPEQSKRFQMNYAVVSLFSLDQICYVIKQQTNCFIKKMSIAGKNPNVTLQIFHFPTQGRQPRNSSGNVSTVQETPEEKNHESHGDLIRSIQCNKKCRDFLGRDILETTFF